MLIELGQAEYNVEVRGSGPALLLLHGFTGSARTWDGFAAAWPGHTTIAVDLLGHGRSQSPADPERYTMSRSVEDMVALLDRLRIDEAAVLGYSMGGRIALRLALAAPGRVSALVLESASPGIDDPNEREARLGSDEALADAIDRDGIEAFVDRWQALPLFASQAALPAADRERLRSQRLRNDPAGLANSLRGVGAGRDEPALDRMAELQIPVHLIVGALDERYCAMARRMVTELARGTLEVAPNAGHAVHLERPVAFAEAVGRFLDGVSKETKARRG